MIKTEVTDDYFFYVQHLKKDPAPSDISDEIANVCGMEYLEKCCLMPRFPEVYLNYVMDRFKPERVLEIGTYFGGSTAFFANVPSVRHIDTIDIKKRNETEKMWDILLTDDQRGKINYIIVDSDEEKKKKIDLHYDFCFIDGLHTYEGVKFDYECVQGKCDVVLFHDYGTNEGVTEFINEVGCEKHSIELSFALKVME